MENEIRDTQFNPPDDFYYSDEEVFERANGGVCDDCGELECVCVEEIDKVCYCGHADVDHHNKLVHGIMQWEVCDLCDCPQFRDEEEICDDCGEVFCEC